MACTMFATLALFLPTAPDAHASNVATLAARLATDTDRLADARADLDRTNRELRRVSAEHRRVWHDVEGRLVAIYKHGSTNGAITRVASGESMGDVGDRLDVLDHVAEHDARAMRRWKRLDARMTKLRARRASLKREVAKTEDAVQAARERLSAAERVAAEARRAAERMARIPDSPLLPKVTSPETEAARAGTDAAAVESGDPAPSAAPQPQPTGFQQSGAASVYSSSFTGEETANGEHYDPGAFTAAHPSLPFGTWVTVSGPGGTVSVRINDRGPFVGGRIIDLSQAAANAVGLGGLAQVTLSVAA
ncbi:MAG: septal ring lytic transglycosylase RlpA family protein [Thermoleophilia bacterium]|nr:septal ring lytic transglycosylase RlpA family protein [Thermoleophilia bacterium]